MMAVQGWGFMTATDQSYRFSGGRTGFLLIHGLGGTPMELRFIAQGLARHGFTVHCPQLAGHCGSEDDIKATGWKDWYASVEAAHAELRKHCDVVIAGGLSMGAILALHLASRHPENVHGTALFAPTLWLNGWSVPWYAKLFGLITQKWAADHIPFVEREPYGIKDGRVRQLVLSALESGDSSKAGFFSTPGSSMLELRWLVKAVKRELGNIRQPALILHPRDDDRSDIDNAVYLQRKLGGLVDMVVLDDSYHIITLDRQRHIVIDRAASFGAWVTSQEGEKASTAAAVKAASTHSIARGKQS
jgi:carboxylesterase